MSPHRIRRQETNPFLVRLSAALERLRATRGHMLVAVSGGPDSTALLVALQSLSGSFPELRLTAVHANHALRGDDSDEDERFTAELCRRLGIELIAQRLPVPLDAAHRNEGIELTARRLRLRLFADTAQQVGANRVATAHTADDQAETVLHRIIRGTGLAGLAGIPAARPLARGITLVRPLLELRRHQVVEYLAAIRQDFREDQSNRDLTFTRNRLRHRLMPLLVEQFNPQLTPALIRLAQHASEARQAIDAQLRRFRRRVSVKRSRNRISLKSAALRSAPPVLVRELIRQLWAEAGWPLRELGRLVLDRIAEVAAGRQEACDLPHGVRAERRRNQLILKRTS